MEDEKKDREPGRSDEPEGAETSQEAPKDIPAEGPGEQEDRVPKRTKRGSRKQLLEHLHRKNTQLMELGQEVKRLEQELDNKKDSLLRLAAEFENYRKRTRREWELLQKRANADLIREIIEGIDNFDRAFANMSDGQNGLQDGLRLIHAGLMDILRRAGVAELDALGKKFDPRYHEALGEIENGEMEEGSVAQVTRKGYLLHDEVLRPARVMVSKKKS